MEPGIIPILHLPGEIMPGQFGPISRERRFCRNSQALTMSSVGIPSVMQTMRSSSASAASMMASAANGGGTKITVVSAPVFSTASCTVLKMGQPSCVVPPLPGVTPPTTCVPLAAQALAWKVPSRPVSPCTINRVFLSTRIAIKMIPQCVLNSPRRGHDFVGRIFHRVADDEIKSRFHQDLFAFVHVCTFEAQHHGKLDVCLLGSLHDASRQRIHAQNAAKNIDQHGLHAFVAEQNFKCMSDLLGIGAAAYIEKVRRHAASILDDIHRSHRQPSTIHHAAHAAVELDVVQAVF